MLLAVGVRLRLLAMPLERDEGEFAYMGQLMLQGIPPYKLACNMKLPGTYAAYAVIMAVFGQTIAAIHTGLLLVLLRYGLVTIMAAVFFINTIDDLGLGGDWKAWYAPTALATLVLLLGIAIYAFWRSLGSREVFEEAA